jgi:glycine cleavage system transcriptional repressor
MHYAIMVIGTDRPGIVAGLTEALREVGCNLEDVSSTILRGYFTMMLVVDAEEGVGAGTIRGALEKAAGPLGVTVGVEDVEEGVPERPVATHVLTAYGSDHPGIVAAFAGLLADRGVNITDLSCRLVGDESPVYAMIAEVSLPEGADEARTEQEVAAVGRELSVDVTFRPVEVETL